MTYREPLSDQVLIFVSAIGPGVLIGFLYDVIFSFFRAFGNKKPIIIIADLSFSVLATVLSFFYMVVYNNGTVRLNIIIAQFMGAVTFHYTLGKYLAKPVNFLADILVKTVGFLAYPFILIYRKSAGYTKKISHKIKSKVTVREKTEKPWEKLKNIPKIYLKK